MIQTEEQAPAHTVIAIPNEIPHLKNSSATKTGEFFYQQLALFRLTIQIGGTSQILNSRLSILQSLQKLFNDQNAIPVSSLDNYTNYSQIYYQMSLVEIISGIFGLFVMGGVFLTAHVTGRAAYMQWKKVFFENLSGSKLFYFFSHLMSLVGGTVGLITLEIKNPNTISSVLPTLMFLATMMNAAAIDSGHEHGILCRLVNCGGSSLGSQQQSIGNQSQDSQGTESGIKKENQTAEIFYNLLVQFRNAIQTSLSPRSLIGIFSNTDPKELVSPNDAIKSALNGYSQIYYRFALAEFIAGSLGLLLMMSIFIFEKLTTNRGRPFLWKQIFEENLKGPKLCYFFAHLTSCIGGIFGLINYNASDKKVIGNMLGVFMIFSSLMSAAATSYWKSKKYPDYSSDNGLQDNNQTPGRIINRNVLFPVNNVPSHDLTERSHTAVPVRSINSTLVSESNGVSIFEEEDEDERRNSDHPREIYNHEPIFHDEHSDQLHVSTSSEKMSPNENSYHP